MSDETQHLPEAADLGRVGFRDIYRAVNESEQRIKEHVSLALLPITTAVADHENRIRAIEDNEIVKVRHAYELATNHEARIGVLEGERVSKATVNAERRRLLGLSNKALGVLIVVVNFLATAAILIYNLITVAPTT